MFSTQPTKPLIVEYQSQAVRKMSIFTLDGKNYTPYKNLGEGTEGMVRLFISEDEDCKGQSYAVKQRKFGSISFHDYELEKIKWNTIHPDNPSFTADTCSRLIMPFLGRKASVEMKALAHKQDIECTLLFFIAVAEEILRVNQLNVHHQDIHERNIMVKQYNDAYKAFVIDFGRAVDEKGRSYVDEAGFRDTIVKNSVWNKFFELTKKVTLWENIYDFSKASFPIQIAIFKYELAMSVYYKKGDFIQAMNTINSVLSVDAIDAKNYPKKLLLNLKFSRLLLQKQADSDYKNSQDTVSVQDITEEIKNYDQEKGFFQGRTETIIDLMRVRNRARVHGLEKIPIEFIEDILIFRSSRNPFFRTKTYYEKTNLFTTKETIDESKLSPTERVIFHLGKKIKS